MPDILQLLKFHSQSQEQILSKGQVLMSGSQRKYFQFLRMLKDFPTFCF